MSGSDLDNLKIDRQAKVRGFFSQLSKSFSSAQQQTHTLRHIEREARSDLLRRRSAAVRFVLVQSRSPVWVEVTVTADRVTI